MQVRKKKNGGGLSDCIMAGPIYWAVQLFWPTVFPFLCRQRRTQSFALYHKLLCGKMSSSQEVAASH